MNNAQYEIQYNLKFFKLCKTRGVDNINVTFTCSLTVYEIETLTFLLAEYFQQQHLFNFEKFTFFNRYKYVIDIIKKDYEQKTDNDVEIQQLFKLFIDNDFIDQVPSFQVIIKSVREYYNTLPGVEVNYDDCEEDCEKVQKLKCLKCMGVYMSKALTLLDSSLQNGWDIFLRPMLGIPLIFFALFKTNMNQVDEQVFNVDGIITNTILQFFYNLLCDRATAQFWNFKKCNKLIETCKEYVLGARNMEYLLVNLNNSSYNTKMYTPLRQFMQKHYNTKQICKLIHKVFIGFYLRVYLEAKKRNEERIVAKGANIAVCSPPELELRNVCHVLFKDYTKEEFEDIINKLHEIKTELSVYVWQDYLVPKECVIKLFNKYDLKKDVSRLLHKTPAFG
ncbi:p48/p45 [Matsumuraeses phaseoli granulovirus]|uniref:P48/p45 n=1 Tax=Matsumuraeses phaseoli granulovirus TaxID=2760664 RepID=A0AAE7MLL0_9BBAC|nr:p48/p45 [Matsumuraeses phaseoli granulovirus]QOD40037.1 p48/p45 [Matsumuraeses phaseoli granulovirus]